MSDEITIITPKSLDEAKSLSALISKSSLLPADLRGKEPEILMTIMTGAELGLAPMQSIRAIDVIKGKPTLKAETMTALVRGRKDVCEYLVLKESTAKKCTYETKRVGDPAPTSITFTIEEAAAAGLIAQTRNGEPNNWMRFPAAMLRARAGSAICKAVYSDLILGVYDPDELAEQKPEPRDVTPPPAAPALALVKPTPPGNVVDSTATPAPAAAADYGANGEPLSDGAKLEVKLEEAQNQQDLDKLTTPIGALKTKAPTWYTKLRARWGERRDELAKSATASTPGEPPVDEQAAAELAEAQREHKEEARAAEGGQS